MVIETSGIIKYYGKFKALDELNINVPGGSIYGFLGKNGAGKTTTLKVLTGLVNFSSGSCSVFNKDIIGNRDDIIRKCGVTIETPGFYSNLTARENLFLLQKLFRNVNPNKLNELLELVELGGEKKVFGNFSMGMKQRLGIAASLLNDPELLLLDEPANGLDPSGIIKMRQLLKRLNAEKKITILVSSHILSEIEQIATHIGIINNGKMVREGTIGEILKEESDTCVVIVNDTQKAENVLKTEGFNVRVSDGTGRIEINCKKESSSIILRRLLENNIEISGFNFKASLEDYFLELVGEENYA